jgi:hypothetical protein
VDVEVHVAVYVSDSGTGVGGCIVEQLSKGLSSGVCALWLI